MSLGKVYSNKVLLHDLILRDSRRRFKVALHRVGVTGARVHVFDKGNTQGTTTVLVSREFGYSKSVVYEKGKKRDVQMEVSAVSSLSNWTTPVPRERPFGSY